jgi:23S rRNA pseudouridine1911/1915/1917 synthase
VIEGRFLHFSGAKSLSRAPDIEAEPDLEGESAFVADSAAAGERLDQWLTARLGGDYSRSRVQALIREGAVRIGDVAVTEPKRKIAPGDRIVLAVPEPEPAEPEGEDIPLTVLFEDEHLIVIDKPAGLVVHPGSGNWTGTLVNALIHHCGASLSGIGGVRRPGIVHRLDKDTSGVMVAAKTDAAHRALSDAFADHGRSGDLERAYAALVWGVPPRNAGTIDAALGRSGRDRTKRAVVSEDRDDARHAVTHFKVESRFSLAGKEDVAALVECRLETGRTHQIRVHMAHIGHPLVGDPEYGAAFRTKANRLPDPVKSLARDFPRQALHARLLSFRHPASGEAMSFETPLPPDMAELVAGFEGLTIKRRG